MATTGIRALLLIFLFSAWPPEQRATTSPPLTRAAIETFLSEARIVSERRTPNRSYAWRVTLDDGTRTHEAAIEIEDGTTPGRRNYRFNVAAYELDKLLGLHMVAPSVVRTIDGRPAAVTWWVDDVAMMEQVRRAKKIEPPDAETWDRQMQAVRLFDELVSNRYRSVGPEQPAPPEDGPPLDYLWMELLITKDWRFWLIDQTGTFDTRKRLQHAETLTRADRGLLRRLRGLNRNLLQNALASYLSAERLDALEARRVLLVKHFDALIARKGEAAVLYDLPER